MHQEEYKGHIITVDTFERGKGYAWSYQIDGGYLRECKDRRPLCSEKLMLSEALDNAKREIDRMPPDSVGT